jgi:DNA helicase-2/ATP-dependent DNA helicase PcrA
MDKKETLPKSLQTSSYKDTDYADDGYIYDSYKTSEVQTKEPKIKTTVKEIVAKLKVNDRVSHPKFGVGVVLSISGTTETKTASIHFEDVGTKILAINFAPLTIL